MGYNNDILIGREEIAVHAQISANLNIDRELNPHILAAQLVDIKPVLGNVMYSDLLKNKTDAKYVTLLEGGEYTKDGKTYTFQGLKSAIACYSFARYIQSKNAVDTPFGMVTKESDYSSPTPASQIGAIALSYRSSGKNYLDECIQYIDTESELSELFESSPNKKPNPGMRIFGISRH